jgi:hypothetical protein
MIKSECLQSFEEISWPKEWSDEIINKSSFISWLNSLGIKDLPSLQPKKGGVGRAYFAGNYVIKFTTDGKEAQAAAVIKNYESPNISKVIDVKLVSINKNNIGENKPLYAIVQEKVNTNVSKRHRKAGQAIYDYQDKKPQFLNKTKKILPEIFKTLKGKYKKDKATKNIIKKMLSHMKKIQDDTGFLTQDTHGANLGFKDRNIAFFDLGRSSIDFDNPATTGAKITKLNQEI